MENFVHDLALGIGGSVVGVAAIFVAICAYAFLHKLHLRLFRPVKWHEDRTIEENWERVRREQAPFKGPPPYWLIQILEWFFACDFDRSKRHG